MGLKVHWMGAFVTNELLKGIYYRKYLWKERGSYCSYGLWKPFSFWWRHIFQFVICFILFSNYSVTSKNYHTNLSDFRLTFSLAANLLWMNYPWSDTCSKTIYFIMVMNKGHLKDTHTTIIITPAYAIEEVCPF